MIDAHLINKNVNNTLKYKLNYDIIVKRGNVVKNILIRNLTNEENKVIEEVKENTGEKTASKALLHAAAEYLLYKKRYHNLERRFFKLVDKLDRLNEKDSKGEMKDSKGEMKDSETDQEFKDLINKHL